MAKKPVVSGSTTSNLPRFSFGSKITNSTEKLQGSFERLAEKWEAKRKTLMNNIEGNGTDGESIKIADPDQADRASAMEQKLLVIKKQQQSKQMTTVPAQARSLIRPPSMNQRRYSLTDQVGMMSKMMFQSKRPELAMSRELMMKRQLTADAASLGQGLKPVEDDLPPFPATGMTPIAKSIDLPLPPPPTTLNDSSRNVSPPSSGSKVTPISPYIISTETASPCATPLSASPTPPDIPKTRSSSALPMAYPRSLPQIPRSASATPSSLPTPGYSGQGTRSSSSLPHPTSLTKLPSGPPPYQRPPSYSKQQLPPARANRDPVPPPPAPSDVTDFQQQKRPLVGRYTRLPPPKHRPHPAPSQPRRPLSHQERQQPSTSPSPYIIQKNQTKSLSAESIIETNQRSPNSEVPSQRGLHQFSTSDGNSSGSLSPQGSSSSSDFSGSQNENTVIVGKKSSGIRIWQGQRRQQQQQNQQPHLQQQQPRPRPVSAPDQGQRSMPVPNQTGVGNNPQRNQPPALRRMTSSEGSNLSHMSTSRIAYPGSAPQQTHRQLPQRRSYGSPGNSRGPSRSPGPSRSTSPHHLQSNLEMRRRPGAGASNSVPSSPAKSVQPPTSHSSQLPTMRNQHRSQPQLSQYYSGRTDQHQQSQPQSRLSYQYPTENGPNRQRNLVPNSRGGGIPVPSGGLPAPGFTKRGRVQENGSSYIQRNL